LVKVKIPGKTEGKIAVDKNLSQKRQKESGLYDEANN
jgi:hypothetical protein